MHPKHIITTKYFPALAYHRCGKGPAVMLLHGFPASGRLWRDVADHLAQSFTVLIPDTPGAGDSRLEGEVATIEELATMVPAVLDDAAIDRCIIAGHSMGGYISLAAAAHYADRLSGLSLVHSTAAADDEEKKIKRSKSITLIRKGGAQEFFQGMVPALFSESYKQAHPEAAQQWIAEGMKLSPETMIAFYNAMMIRPEHSDMIRSVPFPMQWILGKEDVQIPWQSCLQQSSLPDVSFVTLYDECGHMSMLEQPERLINDLRRFIDYCVQKAVEVNIQ